MNDGFARVLGFFFVGIGHIFKGAVTRGITYFLIYSAFIGVAGYQYFEMVDISGQLNSTQYNLSINEAAIRQSDLEGQTIQGFINLNWSSMETEHPSLYLLLSDWQRYTEEIPKLEDRLSTTKMIGFASLGVSFIVWLISFVDICRLTALKDKSEAVIEKLQG
jgi:hypothetical protein